MNIEVRLFARDFNALKISASVVLSSALVASSHNLKITDQIHGISPPKKKSTHLFPLYMEKSVNKHSDQNCHITYAYK